MAYVIAWGLFIIAVALAVYFGYRGHTTMEKHYYSSFWQDKYMFALWGCIIIAIFSGFIASICTFVPIYSEGRCEYWGEQTGRDTKFIRNGFWSWDCYVKTDEGWVTNTAIIKVDD